MFFLQTAHGLLEQSTGVLIGCWLRKVGLGFCVTTAMPEPWSLQCHVMVCCLADLVCDSVNPLHPAWHVFTQFSVVHWNDASRWGPLLIFFLHTQHLTLCSLLGNLFGQGPGLASMSLQRRSKDDMFQVVMTVDHVLCGY